MRATRRALRPGDLLVLSGPEPPIGVFWALVQSHPDDPLWVFGVPVTQYPFLGVDDVAIEATGRFGTLKGGGHCGLGLWLRAGAIRTAGLKRRVAGRIRPRDLKGVRARLHDLATGGGPWVQVPLFVSETEDSADYRDWMSQVDRVRGNLEACMAGTP